jgi:hypothetical protein
MKPDSLTIPQAVQTTMAEVVHWSHELARLHACIAPHFARPEPRRCVLAYLQVPPLAGAAGASPTCEEREPAVVGPSLLGLTVPEVRHLLAHLIWPALTTVSLVLAWSNWRRCHRSWACYYHRQRRKLRQSEARSP